MIKQHMLTTLTNIQYTNIKIDNNVKSLYKTKNLDDLITQSKKESMYDKNGAVVEYSESVSTSLGNKIDLSI